MSKVARVFSLFTGMLLLSAVAPAQDVVRLSESESKKLIQSRIEADYPPIARQMKVSGQVKIEVHLDETGQIEKTQIVTGNPLLVPAVNAAVRKWKMVAATVDSKPSKAIASYSFDFRL